MKFIKRLFKREPEDNSISWISGENKEMQAAIQSAQASYQQFFEAVSEDMNRIVPAISDSLVKYAFPVESGPTKVEHMFLCDFELENGSLFGYLASSPQFTRKVKEGDRIEVKQNQVSDWLYVTSNETKGGHTFIVMWNNFSAEEKGVYGEHPPFCWLNEKGA